MSTSAAVNKLWIPAAVLALFALAGTGLVAVTWNLTHERIANNERDQLLKTVGQILSHDAYENNLLADTITLQHPVLLGPARPVAFHRAFMKGKPVATVFSVIAPDGYNGSITLIVAILEDGTLQGVRVLKHKETPGLGDAIDVRKSGWIHQFDDRSLEDPEPDGWAVRKDGGEFDQLTGATITPRAVVKAVRNALVFFGEHKAEIFAPRPAADGSDFEASRHFIKSNTP